MYGTVKLLTADGYKDVPMLANGATSFRHRQVFHEDLMSILTKVAQHPEDESLVDSDLVSRMAYIMASAADGEKDMNKLSVEDYITWLEQFEAASFTLAAEAIGGLYWANQAATSKGKN